MNESIGALQDTEATVIIDNTCPVYSGYSALRLGRKLDVQRQL